jgi:hypothetical protein
MKSKKYQKRPVKRSSRKPLVTGVVVLLLLAAAAYLTYNHYSSKPTAQHLVSAGQATKGQANQPASSTTDGIQSSSQGTSSPGTAKTSTGSSQTSAPLTAPSGSFVSNNTVTETSQITSVCTTTPGAQCKITFTNGSTVKSLPSETTDSSGSVYWFNWTPQSYGITQGTWKITGIATLGSQTQSTNYAQSLEVSP